jgi:hypothetical protein
MSKNILFITEQTFKDRTGASNAIDGKQLFPMIKVAQDMYILPVLGSTLYNRLQTAIDIDNLTVNEKELIDDYLTDALIWYTMAMLPMVMGYQLFSKGFLQKTAEESNTPSRSDLELLESKYKSMAEYYNTRMIRYLQENYANFYEYINTGSGWDVVLPEDKAYTCPIYLGDAIAPKNPRYVNSASGYKNPKIEYYTATAGLSTFTIAAIQNKVVLSVTRSGLTKVVTTTATADTNKIQIVGTTVTLPTGDVTEAGELFTFLYV